MSAASQSWTSPPGAPIGYWQPDPDGSLDCEPAAVRQAVEKLSEPVLLVWSGSRLARAYGGSLRLGQPAATDQLPLAAFLPPLTPKQLGDRRFREAYGLEYAYMSGAMANGIGSVEIVEAMSRAGMLGSFGAAGLSIQRISQAIDHLQGSLGNAPWCVNLIHSPNEPAHEQATVELFLNKQVRLVEASAYLDLTHPIVQYRVAGLRRCPESDRPVIGHRVIAKVSRVEVATKFLSPPPARIVQELRSAGRISAEQAELSRSVPMADDLTVEADSGGHTDNRPAITLLPTMRALRDRLQREYGYSTLPRVGLAGGIATPASVAAAFAMGAAYVVTGSINQACVESGSSDVVRQMLAQAGQADVTMAPAADMFEMGVKVQVLKRGTMFPMRAQKLYELYRQYPSWDAIPPAERASVQKTIFRAEFDDIWKQTQEFFLRRDPTQLTKAEADPRHKMALVFRWYLGLSSRWANEGNPSRQLDYQVWCGPAMGAFNEWAKGSDLELPQNRRVAEVARRLLHDACLVLRHEYLRQQAIDLKQDLLRDGNGISQRSANQ